ncbi:hypothetical protein N8T08_010827 [Aspergillus melleus]|uniref:Uncharacterized protein n=1 Tax=Aspergillus melleus TaxID=138277 RepID=A0ACC3BCD3_9EURO|nr:hypothetical protein N8T08_010827 [Aspergillus melleus]
MRVNTVSKAPLGLLALYATSASAFWRMMCPSRLVQQRADPIMSPGEVAGHVHTISGGNGFKFDMNYDDARNSDCSSCPIKQDLSNYWTPKLYYHAENGSFISVPQIGDQWENTGGMNVYYFQRGGPNQEEIKAFPKDFRMVAGDPFKRSFDDDAASQAVSFVCLDYNAEPKPETNELPTENCPDGLRVQVFFPSCWDGENLDSDDHKSHVAYPEGSFNDGTCPESHPVHLVSIFYEVLWNTGVFADQWYGDSQPFVLANGDPTGYGFHGDFINGWDVDVLQTAIDKCLNLSGNLEDCVDENGTPVFEFFSDEECQACSVPNLVDEDIDGIFENLPGCNPLTGGPDRAEPQECEMPALLEAPAEKRKRQQHEHLARHRHGAHHKA